MMQENVAALQEAYAAGGRGGFTPQVRAELGHAFARLGNPAAALEQWRQAAADPWLDGDTLARVADGFYGLGDWGEAESEYRRLVVARSDPGAAYRLGLLLAVRQPDAARAYLTGAARDPRFATNANIMLAVLGEDSDPVYAAARLGVAYARVGEWRLAEAQLTRVTEQVPNHARALAYLGLARDRLGEDGYAPLLQALALAPDDPLVHTLMGYHWKQLGAWEAARVEFERAYDLDPANAATSAEIGLMYAAKGDYETTRIWLREATRLAPNDPAFWKLVARFYLDRAFEVESAGLPAAIRAAELAPDDAEAHDLIGWAQLLTGNTEGAAAALNQALRLDPSLASAHYHLGLVYEQRGDLEAARRAFARAAALDPGGPVARLAQRELNP
jgi:tetratricopeptide (TPR) repeat protein